MASVEMPVMIMGGQIYTESRIIENGYLLFKCGKITAIGENASEVRKEEYNVIELGSNDKVIPGFIDIHIHGVRHADTMDGETTALETMALALPEEGTTSFLATTMSQSEEAIEKAVKSAGDFIHHESPPKGAELLGIHLEGPFLNPNKAGAQPLQHIVEPNIAKLEKWLQLSKETIKLVTLAPERLGGIEMIEYLVKRNIVASIGHSDAKYDEVIKATEKGVKAVTHLFNQMRGLHHREPGVVGAALLEERLIAEIIADGIHVSPEMVRLAFKQKGKEGLILITDSIRAKYLENGTYDLGGQDVLVEDGKAHLKNGTLAGSVLKFNEAVKNMIAFSGCSFQDVIEMAAVNPSKLLNIYHKKGSLIQGKDADIVIMNGNLEILKTFCRGELAFDRKEG